MNSNAPADPAAFLSGRERRAWRRAERRAMRDHDAHQLTTLRTLAATGGALTGLLYRDFGGHAAPAEFIIADKRIRAGRVHRPELRALTQAIAVIPAIPLLAASRYGPYWVLTFELPAAPLAVLADKLTILPAGTTARPGPPHPRRPPTGADGPNQPHPARLPYREPGERMVETRALVRHDFGSAAAPGAAGRRMITRARVPWRWRLAARAGHWR